MPELYPYQEIGARFLAEKGRALLADEPGLGKTPQAIAACDALALEWERQTVLVICPASVRENWKREFARFSKVKGRVLEVVSYDKAARGEPGWDQCDVLILDEAHYLKNRTAKRTQAIFGPKCDGVGGLVERAEHVFLLTGTPTPNNPSELWPMLRAVFPNAVKKNDRPMAYWPFVERYCVTRDFGFGPKIIKGKNLPELKERIAPFVLRRKKETVLKDLPPIRFAMLPLEGGVWPRGLEADELALQSIVERGGIEALASEATHFASLRRLTGMMKVEPIVAWLKDWFEGGGGKMVVMAHHLDVIEGIYEGAKASGAVNRKSAVVLTGSKSGAQRQNAIDRFQGEPHYKLFVGQIQAAGTGITLTAASDLLFAELSWVPGENAQAAQRIHRISQRNACTVRVATLAGSIDEKVQAALARKLTDIRELFA